jgi:acyl-CoA-binding protein
MIFRLLALFAFSAAVLTDKQARNIKKMRAEIDKLSMMKKMAHGARLYGLYKQATDGDAHPSKMRSGPFADQLYAGWAECQGMSSDECYEEYEAVYRSLVKK